MLWARCALEPGATMLAADHLSPVSCEQICSMEQNLSCFYSTDAGLRFYGIWRLTQHLKVIVVLLIILLNHLCFVIGCVVQLKEAIAIRKYHFHEMVYVVCNDALVHGTCQSTEHCPKHHNAFCLPSSNSASPCVPSVSNKNHTQSSM